MLSGLEGVKSSVSQIVQNQRTIDAASDAKVQKAAVSEKSEPTKTISLAKYISPTFKLDPATNRAILQFRDTVTGEVLNQIPNQKAVSAYQESLTQSKQSEPVQVKVAPEAPEPPKAPEPIALESSPEADVESDVESDVDA